MALKAYRIEKVGKDLVDLAEQSPVGGQVSIQALTNSGKTDLILGEGFVLAPGKSFPGTLNLGGADKLEIHREKGEGPVDVVVGYA